MGFESDAMIKSRLIDLAVAAVQKWAAPAGEHTGPAPEIKGFPYPLI